MTFNYRREDVHDYQWRTRDCIRDNRFMMLLIDMGMGKTLSTSIALAELLQSFDSEKVLIAAPKRVATKVWPTEFDLWRDALAIDLRFDWLRDEELVEPDIGETTEGKFLEELRFRDKLRIRRAKVIKHKGNVDIADHNKMLLDLNNRIRDVEDSIIETYSKHKGNVSFKHLKQVRNLTDAIQRHYPKDRKNNTIRNKLHRLIAHHQRKEILSLPEQIHIINSDNIPWLVKTVGNHWPYDTVIIDEISGYKGHDSSRTKALSKMWPEINRIIGLTGTPISNDLMGLWAQYYLLDHGERLGKNITEYRTRFFNYNHYSHKYTPLPGAEEKIFSLVEDISFRLDASDYLDMPEIINNPIMVDLPAKAREFYDELEEEFIAEWGDRELDVDQAVTLSGKLLQICNGAVYDEDKQVLDIHDAKIEALRELVDSLGNRPILVVYEWKHDVARIKKAFKQAVALDDYEDAAEDFDKGKIPMLLLHAKSGGHGLNIQHSSNQLVFFGLIHSLEMFNQVVARLRRQGQNESTVVLNHIIAEQTLEEYYIYQRRREHQATSDRFLAHMNRATERKCGILFN